MQQNESVEQAMETIVAAQQRMLASPKPYDIKHTDVKRYKGIVSPWNSWEYILERCGRISDILFDTTEGGA